MEWTKIERYGVGRSEYWKGVHKNLWEREVRGKKKINAVSQWEARGAKEKPDWKEIQKLLWATDN